MSGPEGTLESHVLGSCSVMDQIQLCIPGDLTSHSGQKLFRVGSRLSHLALPAPDYGTPREEHPWPQVVMEEPVPCVSAASDYTLRALFP